MCLLSLPYFIVPILLNIYIYKSVQLRLWLLCTDKYNKFLTISGFLWYQIFIPRPTKPKAELLKYLEEDKGSYSTEKFNNKFIKNSLKIEIFTHYQNHIIKKRRTTSKKKKKTKILHARIFQYKFIARS